MAAVTQGEQRAVAVYDLATHQALWTQPLAASSTPEIVGDGALVVEVGTATHVLDLATGASRGRYEHVGLDYVGASRDGDTLVISLSSGAAGANTRRAGRVVALNASNASERWAHEIAGIVGRPAVAGGVAFVPWIARASPCSTSTRASSRPASAPPTTCSRGCSPAPAAYTTAAAASIASRPTAPRGTRAGSAFLANPLDGVPGDPQVYRDAFMATTGTRTARDKIRFGFHPVVGESGRVSLQDSTIYLAYYHDLVAVDAASGAVRWAQRIDDDIEALQVTSRGAFVASGNGKVRAFEATTGAVSVVAELGASVGAIELDVEGVRDFSSGGAAPEGSVREQLVALVRDADNRLVPFRSFLVGVLRAPRGRGDHARSARPLHAAVHSGQLRQSVATALQGRRAGAQFSLQRSPSTTTTSRAARRRRCR